MLCKKTLLFAIVCGYHATVFATIHNLPMVVVANTIPAIAYHPINQYRFFRSNEKGEAIVIPYQMDEKDKYDDFVLTNGPHPNTLYGNGIFDGKDELSFMGNDIGPVKVPTDWSKVGAPSVLYELHVQQKQKSGNAVEGAIYAGLYFQNPPALSPIRYVNFYEKDGEVITSRYRYRFSPQNYLVVRGVDVTHPSYGTLNLIQSSTFYLKADLKWFFTFNLNQTDIHSNMDAFKVGPVRTIARVNFDYVFLKLNFDLDMYTEVSFFSNSVLLPAVIDNPLDGNKTLNQGSEFYYGLSLFQNPDVMQLDANLPPYHGQTPFKSFVNAKTNLYWLSAESSNYLIYLEFSPSPQMLASNNLPFFYIDKKSARDLQTRPQTALPLGESPVNMAIGFDLRNFSAGLHLVRFRLFIDTVHDQQLIEDYKHVDDWQVMAKKISVESWNVGTKSKG